MKQLTVIVLLVSMAIPVFARRGDVYDIYGLASDEANLYQYKMNRDAYYRSYTDPTDTIQMAQQMRMLKEMRRQNEILEQIRQQQSYQSAPAPTQEEKDRAACLVDIHCHKFDLVPRVTEHQ